jgi:glutathione synthetase
MVGPRRCYGSHTVHCPASPKAMADITNTPLLSQQQLDHLIENVKDYQITHGSLLKFVPPGETSLTLTRPVGVSLIPTPFPKASFEKARRIQLIYNELYAKISQDEKFLERVLEPLMQHDAFAKALWDIHLVTKQERCAQPFVLGIFRSDYMIQHSDGDDVISGIGSQLKQVELNTFSVAGAAHSDHVAAMHSYMNKTGAYGTHFGDGGAIPLNSPINGLVEGLAAAHSVYTPKTSPSLKTGILIIVRHNNFNICDERPLEYGLWNHSPSIPVYRLEFRSILNHVSLGPSNELLFTSPTCPFSPLEISVVYFRAGYEPEEYDENGIATRLLLERSLAIKCPSVLSHLSTFKKVQQKLTAPGILEHFLSPDQCTEIRATFAPLYPLDSSELGLHARALAKDPVTAGKYILKPNLEGGSHNIHGEDIPEFLQTIAEEELSSFVLMEYIDSPTNEGILMSSEGMYQGPTISELGILGVCLWRCDGDGVEMVENREVGWTFKSKPEGMEEMSVVKGYGFFDSPFLTDD